MRTDRLIDDFDGKLVGDIRTYDTTTSATCSHGHHVTVAIHYEMGLDIASGAYVNAGRQAKVTGCDVCRVHINERLGL